MVEKICGLLLGQASGYLPYGALQSLLGVGGSLMSQFAAASVLIGVALALIAVATVLLDRRDVT